MFRSSPPFVEEDASAFRSSPPLVEEDASAFRSSPRHVEVDASAFPISPARAPEDASAPRYEKNAAPPAEPPSLEELWKEMDVALWEALPPAERAKIEAEMSGPVFRDINFPKVALVLTSPRITVS